MFSVRSWPLKFLLIGHGTAQLRWYLEPPCPKEKSILCRSRSRRPWMGTSKKPLNKDSSNHLPPLPLQASSSWPKRLEACGHALTTGLSATKPSSTVKSSSSPLSLVPSALEQLRGARIFSKLDLHSTYNLIRNRKGDECRTDWLTNRLYPRLSWTRCSETCSSNLLSSTLMTFSFILGIWMNTADTSFNDSGSTSFN